MFQTHRLDTPLEQQKVDAAASGLILGPFLIPLGPPPGAESDFATFS